MVSRQLKLKTFWMIKFFAGCMVFMLLSITGIAQRLEYGINMFSTSYLGELNNSNTFLTNVRYGGGMHIRKFINPWWAIRGDANWARIAGSDNLLIRGIQPFFATSVSAPIFWTLISLQNFTFGR